MAGKPWKQELGVAGHVTSTVREQKEVKAADWPTVRVGPLNSMRFPYRHIQSFVFLVTSISSP